LAAYPRAERIIAQETGAAVYAYGGTTPVWYVRVNPMVAAAMSGHECRYTTRQTTLEEVDRWPIP
jgi:hypothetical protein